MGSMLFSAQYQQAPEPPGGKIIKRKMLRYYSAVEPRPTDRIVLSWDIALSEKEAADYSACVVLLNRDDLYFVLEVVRGKFPFNKLKDKIVEVKERYGNKASLVIEDTSISYGLIQSLREKQINVVDYKPKGDKQERLISQIDLFEGGSVRLPKDAPWLDEFVSELLSFPGRHDDQVDALAQVSPGDGKRGRHRLFSERHLDWGVEPLSTQAIQYEICKPLNRLGYSIPSKSKRKFFDSNGKYNGFRPCPGAGPRCISHMRASLGIQAATARFLDAPGISGGRTSFTSPALSVASDPHQFLDDLVNRLKLREAALGDDAMRRTIGLFKPSVGLRVSRYFVSQWRDFLAAAPQTKEMARVGRVFGSKNIQRMQTEGRSSRA